MQESADRIFYDNDVTSRVLNVGDPNGEASRIRSLTQKSGQVRADWVV